MRHSHARSLWLAAVVSLWLSAGCAGSRRTDRIGPLESLPEPKGGASFQDVAWSHDGRHVGYSQYLASGSGGPPATRISIARVDGAGSTALVESALWITFSPDGRRIAFASKRDGDWDVYTAATDGTDVRQITNDPSNDSMPAWSPRGDRIAFSSNRDGRRHVHTMAVDGSDVRLITNEDADDFNPAWNADGSLLAFYRERGDGLDQVHTVRPDGTGESSITRGEHHNTFPSFCRDGRILLHRSDGDEDPGALVAVDPSTGASRVVVRGHAFFARQAPDGTALAFVAGEFGNAAVYVASADGTNVHKLAD